MKSLAVLVLLLALGARALASTYCLYNVAGGDGNSRTTLSYTGGTGSEFVLLSSETVNAPMTAWTRVATNTMTPGNFTIPSVGSSEQIFYRVQSE